MSTPNDAFVEVVFQTRREWEKRPRIDRHLDIAAWDEDRLLLEMLEQFQGLAAFLADEMVCAPGARVCCAALGSLICEMRARRRER